MGGAGDNAPRALGDRPAIQPSPLRGEHPIYFSGRRSGHRLRVTKNARPQNGAGCAHAEGRCYCWIIFAVLPVLRSSALAKPAHFCVRRLPRYASARNAQSTCPARHSERRFVAHTSRPQNGAGCAHAEGRCYCCGNFPDIMDGTSRPSAARGRISAVAARRRATRAERRSARTLTDARLPACPRCAACTCPPSST